MKLAEAFPERVIPMYDLEVEMLYPGMPSH